MRNVEGAVHQPSPFLTGSSWCDRLHILLMQEARLCATGVSITGMSPSTSLKRDRLLQRNAILRRTGFIEAGAAHKGFAGAP